MKTEETTDREKISKSVCGGGDSKFNISNLKRFTSACGVAEQRTRKLCQKWGEIPNFVLTLN